MSTLRPLWTDPALRAMCLALFLVGSAICSLSPYQSLIAVTVFGLSETSYALVLFAAALVSVVASLSIGIWTDQNAKRKPAAILLALAGMFAACLVAVVQQPWAFVVAHVLFFPLTGALFGQIFGMVRLITNDLPTDERDVVMSAVRALFAVPFVVILPIWALAYAQGFPLHRLYPVLVLVNLGLVLVIWWLWPRDGSGHWQDSASGLPVRAAFAEVMQRDVMLRVMCIGAAVSGASIYMVLLSLTFEQAPSRSTSDVALFAGGMAGLEVPIMLGMAVILRWMRRLTAIVAGTLIYAAFLALYPRLADTSAIWLMIIPGAVGGAIMLSLPLAYLQDLMGTRAGVGGALLALQIVLSQGIAALVFALGTAIGGYNTVAAIGAIVMSAGILTLWSMDRRQSKNPGPA